MTIMNQENTAIHWKEVIEYAPTGLKSKILLEDSNCRYTLMSLSSGKAIAEHSNLAMPQLT